MRAWITAGSCLELENEAQPEVDLPWGTEAVDTSSDANAIYVVCSGSSPIDLSRCPVQQAIERGCRQIKVREVEEVVESDAWLDGEVFVEGVTPRDFEVELTQPRQIDLVAEAAGRGALLIG